MNLLLRNENLGDSSRCSRVARRRPSIGPRIRHACPRGEERVSNGEPKFAHALRDITVPQDVLRSALARGSVASHAVRGGRVPPPRLGFHFNSRTNRFAKSMEPWGRSARAAVGGRVNRGGSA